MAPRGLWLTVGSYDLLEWNGIWVRPRKRILRSAESRESVRDRRVEQEQIQNPVAAEYLMCGICSTGTKLRLA